MIQHYFDLANNPYPGGDITVKLYFNPIKLINDSSGDIDPTLFIAFKNEIEQGFLGTGIYLKIMMWAIA